MVSKRKVSKIMRLLVGVGAVLCLMGLLLPLPPRVNAVITTDVSVDAPATVAPGGYFTAQVDISQVTDFDAALFEVVFESSVLEIEDITPGTDITKGKIATTDIPIDGTNEISAGRVRILPNVPGAPGVTGEGYLCRIRFHAIGAAGTSSTINLENGSLSDKYGDAIAATWTGTTVNIEVIDTTPPTVTATSPVADATDVGVDSNISVTFSEAMSEASAQSAFSTSPGVTDSFSWVGNTMTFNPTANLDYGTTYTVTIAGTAEDLAGNGLDGDGDGTAEGSPTDDYEWSFTTEGPPACNNGSANVAFVPNSYGPGGGRLPTTHSAFSAFSFTNVPYASVSAATLANYDTVVLITCDPMNDLTDSQRTDIVNWVSNGGKLIIYDSECKWDDTIDNSWLPYPYTTYCPGAWGADKDSCPWVDLEILEDNTLSSTDPASPYYINASKIAYDTDAAGDQNVFIAQSAGWCGDMLGTNALYEGEVSAPGTTGYSHAYAHYSKGLFIYNGLDIDYLGTGSDPTADTGRGYLAKIWLLELEQTWDEFTGINPCGLPCGAAIVPLSADFTATPRRGTAPLRVRFTDLSTGEIESWAWDFGDDNTSTLQNPTNTYANAGTYTVSLTVTGLGDTDTETKTNYITVRAPEEVIPGLLPEPAKIGASYLHISPEQIVPSQWVEISANIYNRGGVKKSHTVALYINGYLAQSQTVGVSPGGTELVVFRVRADSEFLGGIYTGPGTYEVNIEGMVGQFFVLAEQEIPPAAAGIGGPLGTGGIIAIVVVVIVLIVGLVFGLRRE